MDMLGLDDATLIARGRYATLRSAHRKHANALRVASVAVNDQARMMLTFVDDASNLSATHDAFIRRVEEIREHVGELLELTEQLEALKPAAWGKTKLEE